MENLEINVVDGIMGSGKSTAIINFIKTQKENNPEEHFLIIVPYLTEINRYLKDLNKFKGLTQETPPKKILLQKYLQEKCDIICTHSLFLQNPDLISEFATDYTLVIDEALNSLISVTNFPTLLNSQDLKSNIKQEDDNFIITDTAHTYNFTNWDINNMVDNDFLIKSQKKSNLNLLTWNPLTTIDSIYTNLENYFTQYDVYTFSLEQDNSNNYITLFPIQAFSTLKIIYVLTYLWDAQIMKAYFDFYGANYKYLYPIPYIAIPNNNHFVGKLGENTYLLNKSKTMYLKTEQIIFNKARLKLHIPGYMLDDKNVIIKDLDSRCALYKNIKPNLSYTFYSTKLHSDLGLNFLTTIKKNIRNFIDFNVPINIKKNHTIIWSVYDCAKEDILKRCKYINSKNYVPINTKASNEYKDANTLIYLVNRYINPCLYNFIIKYCNPDFNMNLYSLSELIQWIWRSAIRDNKETSIYIPNNRMLSLFLEWINSSSTDELKNSINKNYIFPDSETNMY